MVHERRQEDGATPLLLACYSGTNLLPSGENMYQNCKKMRCVFDNILLHYLLSLQLLERVCFVSRLLKLHPDAISAKDVDGWFFSCSMLHLATLMLQLQYLKGETALHYAVAMMPKTSYRLAKVLLKCGPELASVVSNDNYLPLHQAVMGVASPAVLQVYMPFMLVLGNLAIRQFFRYFCNNSCWYFIIRRG